MNKFSTSRERMRPLVVQFWIKEENSSVDLMCLLDTWPRFWVRHLPKYLASTEVGEFTLDTMGLTGIKVGVIPLLWVLRLTRPSGNLGSFGG